MITTLTKQIYGLYVILTDPVTGYEHCARAAVEAGVKYLQLRMKNTDMEEFRKTAALLREITKGTETLFIVNDSLDVAMAVDADGIHLGQDDMDINEARATWKAAGKIFGLSTHNENQVREALKVNPDYIGVGPVFPTPTKVIPDPVVGMETMGRIIKAAPIPAVAIGGINRKNLPDVLKNGAQNFSAVRAVTLSREPGLAIKELMDIWRKKRC